MSYTNLKSLNTIFEELSKYIGLDIFKIQSHWNTQDNIIHTNFSFDIKSIDIARLEESPERFMSNVFDPIVKSIQESEAVKDAKMELTDKVKELETLKEELNKEIERLKPFENYYNMALKMEHGS